MCECFARTAHLLGRRRDVLLNVLLISLNINILHISGPTSRSSRSTSRSTSRSSRSSRARAALSRNKSQISQRCRVRTFCRFTSFNGSCVEASKRVCLLELRIDSPRWAYKNSEVDETEEDSSCGCSCSVCCVLAVAAVSCWNIGNSEVFTASTLVTGSSGLLCWPCLTSKLYSTICKVWVVSAESGRRLGRISVTNLGDSFERQILQDFECERVRFDVTKQCDHVVEQPIAELVWRRTFGGEADAASGAVVHVLLVVHRARHPLNALRQLN